MISKINALSAI